MINIIKLKYVLQQSYNSLHKNKFNLKLKDLYI